MNFNIIKRNHDTETKKQKKTLLLFTVIVIIRRFITITYTIESLTHLIIFKTSSGKVSFFFR